MGNLGSLGRLLHLHLLHVVVQQQAVVLVEGGVLVQLHLQGGQSLVQQSWSALPRPADITASAVESSCSKGNLLVEGIKHHLVPGTEGEEGLLASGGLGELVREEGSRSPLLRQLS